MPMCLHALAALVLGNFRFASFLKRAHSDFRDLRVLIQPLVALQRNSVLVLWCLRNRVLRLMSENLRVE